MASLGRLGVVEQCRPKPSIGHPLGIQAYLVTAQLLSGTVGASGANKFPCAAAIGQFILSIPAIRYSEISMTKKPAANKNESRSGPAVPSRRLELFLRRSNRLVTIVGALIVFVTFVVKEGLREHWRDSVESVVTAQHFFQLRSESDETRLDVSAAQQAIDALRSTTGAAGTNEGHEEMTSSLRRLWELQQRTNAYLRALSDFVKSLPDEETASQQFAVIRNDFRIAAQSLTDLACSSSEGGRGQGSCYMREMSTQQFDAAVSALEKNFNEINSKAHLFAEQERLLAEQARRRRERRYVISTWLSYGLYTFGWAISLIGSYYGFHDYSGGE
jgi:hypothetical protein